jgi:hypothetical protein
LDESKIAFFDRIAKFMLRMQVLAIASGTDVAAAVGA